MVLARVFGTPIRRLLGDDVGREPLYSIRRGPDVVQGASRRRRVGPYPADVHALHTFYPLAEGMPSDRMFPYFIRVQNVADTNAPRHEHHGHEFFYVLDGELELTINVEENTVQHVLGPGDACYLDSSVPHLARGRTKNPYSAASAEIFDVFWCPLGESYLFED
jgi:mannose-6-phosphate isomerase-like protein (cupin superfamily)